MGNFLKKVSHTLQNFSEKGYKTDRESLYAIRLNCSRERSVPYPARSIMKQSHRGVCLTAQTARLAAGTARRSPLPRYVERRGTECLTNPYRTQNLYRTNGFPDRKIKEGIAMTQFL